VAYRDAHLDARSAGLAAAVSGSAALIEERIRVCREHDEVAERVDELGRRLAGLERAIAQDGVIAMVKRWLGASPAALRREAEKIRGALAERTSQLAALVSREIAISAQLAEVEVARDELARVRASRGRALRRSESPLGHELRRIDEELAAAEARMTSLDKALVAADRVDRIIADIRDIVEASARAGSLAEIAATAHAVISFDLLGPSDRDLARGRLRDHIAFARDELRAFIDAFEVLKLGVELPTRLALAQLRTLAGARFAEPPENSELVVGIESAASCTARLVAVVGAELASSGRRRDALVAQQRGLESRSG
jgi:hypothetical protein